eukprot:gene1210-1283_t
MLGLKRQKTYDVVPNNLLSVRGLSFDFVQQILVSAEQMKDIVQTHGGDDRLKHRILATAFFEPSTRTHCSFQAAMLRLGGSVIDLHQETSSLKKGESLVDTIQTLACYADAIVIRHPQKGSADVAANVSSKPVINAGDGTGEHPTQALLDLFTIKSELGTVGSEDTTHSMVITLLGDLKHGRTVHSLVVLLSLFPNIKLIYVSPAGLEMPEEIKHEVKERGIEEQITNLSLQEAIGITDVLYVTRIQKERFASEEEYDRVSSSYCVDVNLMEKAKEKMIVMHPLPRLNEIDTAVDVDPRAAYFRQMENGMYTRMAILSAMLLNK